MRYLSSNSAFQSDKETYLLPSDSCFIAESHFNRTEHQCKNTGKIGARSNSRRRCDPDEISRWARSTNCRSTPCQTRSPGAGRQV